MSKEHHHDCLKNPDPAANNCLRVDQLYRQIKALPDFTPSERVNYLFSSLVSHALNPAAVVTLSEDEIQDLQRLCGLAEFELEKYWARKVLVSSCPEHTLEQFPYYGNYQKLTKLEHAVVMGSLDEPKGCQRWAFVGSGPMPLTAIILARDYSIDVTLIDFDKEAVKLSTEVTARLGLKVAIVEAAGEEFDGYQNHNAVFVAALAGSNPQLKQKIFQRIHQDLPVNGLIIARSTHSNRRLLYNPVNFSDLGDFNPVLELHPHSEIVNSVLIAQKSV